MRDAREARSFRTGRRPPRVLVTLTAEKRFRRSVIVRGVSEDFTLLSDSRSLDFNPLVYERRLQRCNDGQ